MPTLDDSLRHVRSILDSKGIRSALIYLNGLTDHRFTSLYRFNSEMLDNLYFFDRENPEQEKTENIPILASYCVFVRQTHNTFVTEDSLTDERVRGHPKHHEVQSYCGVPLLDEDGKMFGTNCHFDVLPVEISKDNVKLLEAVGPMINEYLVKQSSLAR